MLYVFPCTFPPNSCARIKSVVIMLFLNRSFNRHQIFYSSVTMLFSHRNNQEPNLLPINPLMSCVYERTRHPLQWSPQHHSHSTDLNNAPPLCPWGCCNMCSLLLRQRDAFRAEQKSHNLPSMSASRLKRTIYPEAG